MDISSIEKLKQLRQDLNKDQDEAFYIKTKDIPRLDPILAGINSLQETLRNFLPNIALRNSFHKHQQNAWATKPDSESETTKDNENSTSVKVQRDLNIFPRGEVEWSYWYRPSVPKDVKHEREEDAQFFEEKNKLIEK